ncbi:CYFA0S37e00232g1_1 [Cyberlindnera fabianii]|uniref:CYFA0S37e00232g1_1 n=1 Tax=Cyberlindnera fabianii TaxID=36022 RepID=A0A061BEF5_CYBFA|nr:Thiamine pathway transporter THI73 [Cyberlindnera fabianii]CDR47752.1 CYFA0S37e00232g1_1 [Cyberlindnera fabianii]
MSDIDVAKKYLEKEEAESVVSEEVNYSHVLRKVDLHIMPIVMAIYFFQFLDKALLNYSAVMGIKKNLKGNEFANLGTIFNVAYIIGEPISGYLLQRFPLAKTFTCAIVGWAIVVACHAACHTYASLMVMRVLLGLFESSTVIALVSITGMYYTRSEQSKRIGIWAAQAGTATIIGGLMSFAFQHVNSSVLEAWQILFMVFGIITFLFGGVIYLCLPDNLANAKFLTELEKRALVEHVRDNQTGIENKKFKWEQVKELLFGDVLTWLMFVLTITSQIVTGSLGTFSTTVVATFGFSNKDAALLQIPIGVMIVICCVCPAWLVSRYGSFTIIHISTYVPSIAGAGMLFSHGQLTQLFGLYLLYPGSCAITLLYVWNGANTAGHTKRIFRNAVTMVAFGVANIIGPQLFQANTAPRYVPAKITILVTQAVSILLSIAVGYICRQRNNSRPPVESYTFDDSTDLQNPSFRYLW